MAPLLTASWKEGSGGDWAWVPDSWATGRNQVGFQMESGADPQLWLRSQRDKEEGVGSVPHHELGEWCRVWALTGRGDDTQSPCHPKLLGPWGAPRGVTEESMGNWPGWSREGQSDGRWPWSGDRTERAWRGLAYTQAPS